MGGSFPALCKTWPEYEVAPFQRPENPVDGGRMIPVSLEWRASLGRFHVSTITPPAARWAVPGLTWVRDGGHSLANVF